MAFVHEGTKQQYVRETFSNQTVNQRTIRYFRNRSPGTESHECRISLTLNAPITTAADDKFYNIFLSFQQKMGMIFHENRLPADDSHEISCIICYF